MPKAMILHPVIFALALVYPAGLLAQKADTNPAKPESAVLAFHEALRTGDVAAVKRLLASDAVILEGGQRESRDEYLSHHLEADIEFAKAVPSQTRKLESNVNGDVAWVISTSVSAGAFRDRPVNLVGAELVVLARSGGEWKIRAVHWSSHQAK